LIQDQVIANLKFPLQVQRLGSHQFQTASFSNTRIIFSPRLSNQRDKVLLTPPKIHSVSEISSENSTLSLQPQLPQTGKTPSFMPLMPLPQTLNSKREAFKIS
jgi:hypothetical protein